MKIQKPATYAAGSTAIFNTLKMVFKVMNPVRAIKVLNALNQKDGIDCPGCAWPDPEHRSSLGEYCENGAKAIAEEAMDASADEAFFSRHTIASLREQSDYWLGQKGRLVRPMIIRKGDEHYQPIGWDEAYQIVSDHLRQLPHRNDAIFYTSGRTSNEAAFLYQLFARMMGTNNLPDCSNMCHESSGVALNHTLGIGKGSVKLEDFYKSELILIFGQNPGTNHPRMLSALEKAKQNGAKVVVINPLKEAGLLRFNNPQKVSGILGKGTDIADLYLQVKINEDVSLLKAVMIDLLHRSAEAPSIIDTNFIQDKTAGYEALRSDLSNYNYSDLVRRTGLSKDDVAAFTDLVAERNKIIGCWAMGLTQHVNAVDNIQELINLLLLKGSIGKEGAGTCPVRGHSNVQGDRTMGIHEKPSREFLDTLSHIFKFDAPEDHGVDVVESISEMYEHPGKVFMSMGGNFVSAAPDTNYTTKAMEKCRLTIHVSTKLNRTHLHHGDIGLILPCLGRTDQIIEKSGKQVLSVENSMGIVHTTQGNQRPRSAYLRSEPHIIAQIASRALGNDKVDWNSLIDDYDQIRDLIAKSVKGFEDFNKKLKEKKIFELPNGPREGIFTNDIGKARFTVNALPDYTLKENELLMMTIRSHDQYNTTVYGLDDRYRGIKGGRKIVLMCKKDIEKHHVDVSRPVTLFNAYDHIERAVEGLYVVPYDIPEGSVATYFPECNPLIPLSLKARKSNTPASKSVKVLIRQ